MKGGSALLTILLLICLAHPAEALIKRSKKDECTLCHVLWMEAFLTDEPTLLGPTQTNIVIDGSTGLSSSKRVCYSCHDGYVKDSRNIIDLGNKHHQLKKVPDWLDLPKTFRLDINNEIYCGTCHGFHDVRSMGEVGSMPFMRLDNDRSEMCMACHKDKAKEFGFANHPVNVRSDIIPVETIKELGGKLGPNGEIICQTCHMPHKKPTLVAPFKGSAICLICHGDKKTVFRSDHNLAITFPKIRNSRGNGVDDTGPCSMCHIPHRGNSRWMWARETGEGNPASQVCLSCHGKELGIRVTGRYSHPVGEKLGKSSELPLFSDRGIKDENGKVHCPSCHNVHKWNPGDSIQYKDGMEGGPTNSFLRKSNEGSGLCISCHDDKKEIQGTDHDLRITVPDSKNGEGRDLAASGPCGACHIPHNAAGEKLWARTPFSGNPASGMCLSCHGKENEHIQKTVGQYSHPVGVSPPQDTAEKSGLPFFSEQGKRKTYGTIQCATCHNPHRWTPDRPSPGSRENIEGDAANSFLRIANNSSGLCLKCHENKQQVLSSDHNLLGTAPAEINLMAATPEQSGPCGACHIPHNGSGPRLWAKQLSGKEDYVTRLCFSCHKKDGAAQKKRINGNSHPVDVPIARINPGEKVLEQFPLYSHDGKKQENGRVACTTCHDPHSWSSDTNLFPPAGGKPGNREGDEKSSFLRKANYPPSTLCKTCHVEQKLIEGTPHDLNVTAPDEKNLLGQTARESGTCGTCHLVHNSPNSLKMWARPYGPARKNENKMISLCTSCHSEGKVAGNKVQKIATHPEGIITTSQEGLIRLVYDDSELKNQGINPITQERYTPILITNILGYLSGKSYTPLFNNKGEKVTAGKISCPSCHNVHKWNLEEKSSDDGERKKLPGAKFLRTESYNLVCIDCHGQDALYRYMFFHSPSSRSWSVKK